MAKRKVLESTCDSCHRTESVPLNKFGRVKFVLPKGWVHVQGNRSDGPVFAIDMCDECVTPILKAAGRYRD